MAEIKFVLTSRRCPDCGNFLSKEDRQTGDGVREMVSSEVDMLNEYQKSLDELDEMMEKKEIKLGSPEERDKLKKIMPKFMRLNDADCSVITCRTLLVRRIKRKKKDIEYEIREGKDVIVYHCEHCGYTRA